MVRRPQRQPRIVVLRSRWSLAKADVYVPPISDDNNPSVTISPQPDAAYQAKATTVARSQVTLAGYRLAALLNKNLK